MHQIKSIDRSQSEQEVSINQLTFLIFLFLNVIILKTAYLVDEQWYWAFTITMPVLIITVYRNFKKVKRV